MLPSVPVTIVALLVSVAAATPASSIPQLRVARQIALEAANGNGTAVCPDGKTNGPIVKHKVVQGDTLTKLSATFQSGICNIVKESKLANPDALSIAQELSIPTKLCKQNIDDKSCLKKSGTRPCLPVTNGQALNATRVIKAGDTFVGISQELDLDVNAVLAANPGVNRFNLTVGQVVKLPVCCKT